MVVTSTLAMLLNLAAPELSSVPMTWLAPAACPDAASVEARLADALADAPADTRKDITAHATVTATEAGGFALDLRLTGDGMDATRALASTDCRELADATVLIVALAADPTVLDRGAIPLTPPPLPAVDPDPATDPDPTTDPEPTTTPGPTADPDPAADPDPPADPTADGEPEPAPIPAPLPVTDADPAPDSPATTDEPRTTNLDPDARARPPRRDRRPRRSRSRRKPERAPSPPRDDRLHVGLRALGGVGLRTLPSPTADLSVTATVWRRLWRAELGVTYWTPQSVVADVMPPIAGRFQLWAVEPRGCYVPGVRTLEFPLCVGLDLGAVHGVGTLGVTPTARASVWLAAAASAAFVFRPANIDDARLGFWLRGEVLPALTQPKFATSGSSVVFSVPVIGGRVGAGIEVRLR